MFGVVDLTFFQQFLSSILGTLDGVDPAVAGLGAVVLLVLQRLGGGKFDVVGFVRTLLGRFAPSNKGGSMEVPADLTPVETGLLQQVLARIKASRENAFAAAEKAHADVVEDLKKVVK